MQGRMTHEPTWLIAMGVDSDNGCRMRLKVATQAVTFFKTVTLFQSMHEAASRLEGDGTDVDVIFISERLPREEINTMIKRAKECPHGQDAAFILLLSGTSQDDSAKAAQSLLSGFDGCLSEPYSVQSLTEISRLATKIRGERREAREKAALSFLLKDVMKQIDRLAYIKGADMDVGDKVRRLKEACGTFNTLDPDAMNRYFDLAATVFELAQPPAKGGMNYQGTSKRIKKKMAQHMLDKIDHGAADTPPKEPKKE
jgi:CheY-like chemotaxis protein